MVAYEGRPSLLDASDHLYGGGRGVGAGSTLMYRRLLLLLSEVRLGLLGDGASLVTPGLQWSPRLYWRPMHNLEPLNMQDTVHYLHMLPAIW